MDDTPAPLAELVELTRPSLVRARVVSVHAQAFALIGALAFVCARLVTAGATPLLWACPLRAATGVPCPSCGATHAFVHLAHGEVALALWASPLFALLATGLWATTLVVAARLVGFPLVLALPQTSPAAARALRLLAVGAVLVNWAFVAFVSGGGAP